jgi:hypothetical protein
MSNWVIPLMVLSVAVLSLIVTWWSGRAGRPGEHPRYYSSLGTLGDGMFTSRTARSQIRSTAAILNRPASENDD